jgi:hypothetical protein
MGDLEHVEAGEAACHERGVDVLLGIAGQQEDPSGCRAKQDDAHAVDRTARRARLPRDRPGLRPDHVEAELGDIDPPAGCERLPWDVGPRPQEGVPRLPARAGAGHPGLEDAPDPVPLDHADQPRDMVLVGMGEHEHVHVPVPRRDSRVELQQQAFRVGTAVDQHALPGPALQEDRVTLAHVEHDQARCAGGCVSEGHRGDHGDDGRRGQQAALERGAAAWMWCRPGARRSRGGRPPAPAGQAARDAASHTGRGDGEDDTGRSGGQDRCDLRREDEGGQRQAGRRPDDHDDHVEQQPPGKPGERRHDGRSSRRRRHATHERDDARRHGRGHQRHHREVDHW